MDDRNKITDDELDRHCNAVTPSVFTARRIVSELRAERAGRARAEAKLEGIRDAVRKHRDATDHARCHLDDQALYEALGEPVPDRDLPPCDDFIATCIRFWRRRKTAESQAMERCAECLASVEVVWTAPDALWARIAPNVDGNDGAGSLCVACADRRMAAIGVHVRWMPVLLDAALNPDRGVPAWTPTPDELGG